MLATAATNYREEALPDPYRHMNTRTAITLLPLRAVHRYQN